MTSTFCYRELSPIRAFAKSALSDHVIPALIVTSRELLLAEFLLKLLWGFVQRALFNITYQ